VDVVRGEVAEAQLTAFIERRDRQRRQTEGERRIEEAWMDSERRYEANRRREIRAAWVAFHEGQAERHRRTLEDLIKHNEAQAARLCEEGAA
jgi:hypothetical protein